MIALIVALVIISVIASLLLAIVIYGAEKLAHLRKVERAVRNAWFTPGECDADECLLRARAITFPTITVDDTEMSPSLALKLGDYIARVDLASRVKNQTQPIEHPTDSTVLSILPAPKDGPSFGAIYRCQQGIVIAMRGTSTTEEVRRDLQSNQVPFPSSDSQSMVHKGFAQTWYDHRVTVMDVLKIERPTKVFITGHSLENLKLM
jgi:hypothetical protein